MNLSNNTKHKLLKLVKITGITLGSAAALLYVLPYFFKDTITKSVNEIANDYIKSDVAFKDIDLSFYSHFPNLTVGLHETKIGSSDNFKNQNLINAEEIALGIDLFSLFGDKISFNQLYISNAEINIKTDSLGHSNYDIFVSEDEVPKDDSTVNLEFKRINIKNANVVFDDQKNKVLFKAENLNYKGQIGFVNNTLDLNANTEIDQVFFAFDETTYVNKKSLKGILDTKFDLDNLKLTFKKNQLMLAKFPFEISGEIKLPENEIDFDLLIRSNKHQLSDLLSVVPPSYQHWYENTKIEGFSSFEFYLTGKMNPTLDLNPTMKLKLAVSNGFINHQSAPNPIKNLNFKAQIELPDLNVDKAVLNISSFSLNLADGFAKGDLNFTAPTTLQSNLEAKLNLAFLKQAAGLSGFDMKGLLDIQATIDGSYKSETRKVGIRNKEETYVASVPKMNIKATLSNGYFKMKELPLAVEEIFADIEVINTDGVLAHTSVYLNQIKAKAANNFIDGYVKVENLYNFKMKSNVKADLNLADITAIYPVESFEVNGHLAVDFNANGTYEPKKNIFPVSNSFVKLDRGYLKYTNIPELPIQDINVELNVSSAKGSMNDLRVEVLPISFVLAGEKFMIDADLYNFNNLTYKINSKGTLDLNKIYRVFAIEGYNVNGLIVADMNISGNSKSSDPAAVRNRGFVDLQNIYLDSELFPNSFIIQNGKLKFQRDKMLLENVNAKYASNHFKIGGSLTNYINFALKDQAVLDGTIDIETNKLNVDDFMVFNTPVLNTSKGSKNSAPAGVVLVPENFNIGLNANAKKVYFDGLELANFKGNLTVNKGVVLLNDTKFNLIGSSFGMKGSYQPVTPKMAKFSYTIKASDFDIQKAYKEIKIFRELASAAKNVFGSISLDYSLSGVLDANMFPKMKSISGAGVLTLDDIQFKGFKLFNAVSEKTSFESLHDAKASKVEIKTFIKNNVMTIEPTKFKIAGFRPKIQGQVTLDGRMNLGFRLGLPPFGIIGIPLTITGTSEDMNIKLGKQKEEALEETDEEYENYKKSLEDTPVSNEN